MRQQRAWSWRWRKVQRHSWLPCQRPHRHQYPHNCPHPVTRGPPLSTPSSDPPLKALRRCRSCPVIWASLSASVAALSDPLLLMLRLLMLLNEVVVVWVYVACWLCWWRHCYLQTEFQSIFMFFYRSTGQRKSLLNATKNTNTVHEHIFRLLTTRLTSTKNWCLWFHSVSKVSVYFCGSKLQQGLM